MTLCVPASSPGLEAPVDPRLGRASWFVLVDEVGGGHVADVANGQDLQAASGAGVQSAQAIAAAGAEAVLCANVGPKAYRVLRAAGVRVYTGAAGTVADAVQAYREGRLEEAAEANVDGHW